jgi:arginase
MPYRNEDKNLILTVACDLGSPHVGGGVGARQLGEHFYAWCLQQGYETDHRVIDIPAGAAEESEILNIVRREAENLLDRGCRLWCFTATHSFTPAFVAALGAVQQRCGLVWLDGHADFHTSKTSNSGQLHGMSLALLMREQADGCPRWERLTAALGNVAAPEAVALGLRDLDIVEWEGVERRNIFNVDVDSIIANPSAAADTALKHLLGVERVCVSFDIDFLDANVLPGSASPAWAGPGCVEAGIVLANLLRDPRVALVEVTEYNPVFDCVRFGLHQTLAILTYAARASRRSPGQNGL